MIGVSYMYIKPIALDVNKIGFCAAYCGTDYLFKCEYPCNEYHEYISLIRNNNIGD